MRTSPFIKARARAPSAGAALGLSTLMLGSVGANAQQAPVSLPAVTVDAPVVRKKVAPPKPVASRVPARTAVRQPVRQAPQTAAQPVAGAASPTTQQSGGPNGGGGQAGSAYNPRESQITRLPTRIVDTPQSITVIPQQVIQDQHTSTLVETLHNVPGISFLGGEGGTQGDNINIHGYSARNDIYRDGIRDPGWYTRDTFSVDEVEVLKGPSSFAFGRGSTGGVVNLTSKLPKFTDFTTLEVAGYTSPGVRSTLDVNRTFGESAARIVLLGNDTDVADRDHVVNRRVGVAPSITTNFSADTRATLSYIYQHDANVPDYGIPLIPGSYFGSRFAQPAPVSKNTFYGTVEDQEVVNAHIATLKLEHELNRDWKVTNQTRYSNIDRFVSVRGTQTTLTNPTNFYTSATGGAALATVPQGADLNNLFIKNANYFQNHTQNSLLTNQTDLTGHFHTGFLEHTTSTGVELDQESRDQLRSTYTGAFDRVNVGAPDANPAVLGSLPLNSTNQSDLGRGIGVYGSDQIKLNQYFELMAGLRYDHLTVDQYSASQNTLTGAVSGPYSATVPYNVVNTVDFVSWRAGAVAHPVQNASIYFMYGTSFDPTSEYLTITGGTQSLQPTTNQTYEVGAKYDLFDQKLSLTGALFRVTQDNAVEAINSTLGIYQEVGTTRVQGAELGIAGKITDKWSAFGGYTYMDGRVLASAISQTTGTFVSAPGNKLQDLPRNTIAMSTTYALTSQFTAGGSAYYTSDRYTSSADTGRVPGYWRFDTMASYKVNQKFSLQLNIQNLLDTKNFESLSGFGAAQPGPGRTAILSGKYTF